MVRMPHVAPRSEPNAVRVSLVCHILKQPSEAVRVQDLRRAPSDVHHLKDVKRPFGEAVASREVLVGLARRAHRGDRGGVRRGGPAAGRGLL